MKPQWGAQVAQLSTAIDIWRSISANLPKTFQTAQGLSATTEDLGHILDELLAAVTLVNENPNVDSILLGIQQGGVLGPIPNIAAAIEGLRSNPSDLHLIDQIAQNTWNIRASIVWLIPNGNAVGHLQTLVTNFDLESKAALIRKLSVECSKEVTKVVDAVSSLLKRQDEVEQASQLVLSYERESATAKTNAEASAATAASHKEAIGLQLTELSAGLERQRTLQDAIYALKNKAESTLESTSKVALAASFSSRKTVLQSEKKFWQSAFVVGIAMTLVTAVISVLGIFTLPPILQDGNIEIGPILTRLILFGPLVWFTWFSVRQYGTATRLIEDYAFKEASALAFVGYQREMAQDPEMIKLLRESAIKNFGSQPTRIFEKPDPASPLHDLLDKALEKGAADKFIELLKILVPGKH